MRTFSRSIALVLMAVFPEIAAANALIGSVYLTDVTTSFRSVGEAKYLDDLGRSTPPER